VTVASHCSVPVETQALETPSLAVVPVDRWSAITKQGLELAARLAPEVIAVHVEPGEHYVLLQEDWERYVAKPYRDAGGRPPELKVLPSPYRFVVLPVVQYILELADEFPDRRILVVIPEFVEDHWYEYFLHNQRARLLEWMILAKGNKRIFTVASPYYIPQVKPPKT
jgi:hypothetical protein